jgi:hypothetical protein
VHFSVIHNEPNIGRFEAADLCPSLSSGLISRI